jgi:uncharacterized lipoprotein YajG
MNIAYRDACLTKLILIAALLTVAACIALSQTVIIEPPPRPTPTPTPKVFNMIFLFVLTVSGRMPMSYDRC